MPVFRGALTFAVATVFVMVSGTVAAQPPQEPAAFKLPDGTIVFYTATPNEPNPPVDAVRLSAAQYAQLLNELRQAKEAAAGKTVAPSECRLLVTLEQRTNRPVAVVRQTVKFKTVSPRTSVRLGGQNAFLTAAKYSNGDFPVLQSGPEGLSVLVAAPGEYELNLDAEAALVPQSGGQETGFEFRMPRAPISSLAFEPGEAKIASVLLTTRLIDALPPRPRESRRLDRKRLEPPNAVPLGPIDTLAVSWESRGTGGSGLPAAATIDAGLRLDEANLETTARIRWNSPGGESKWHFPAGCTVAAERVMKGATMMEPVPALITPPAAANLPWTLMIPDAGEWLITVTQRNARTTTPGPIAVGPYWPVGSIRTSGVLKCFAPPAVKLTPRNGPRLTPIDPPNAAGEENPIAAYAFGSSPSQGSAPAVYTFDVQTLPGSLQIRPLHRLRLLETGWKLRSEFRVIPIRRDVDRLVVEIPTAWSAVVFGPAEAIEDVSTVRDDGTQRTLAVALTQSRREPFDLTLETTIPLTAGLQQTHRMARVVDAREREGQVSVTVPDGLEVRTRGRERIDEKTIGPWVDGVADSNPGRPHGAVGGSTCRFDRGVADVEVAWHVYRPVLHLETTLDVQVGERQSVIHQVMTFSAPAPMTRRVRLRGPSTVVGLRATPHVEPGGAGDYGFDLQLDPGRPVNLTLTYALPHQVKSADAPLPLGAIWTDDATHTTALLRLWGPAGRTVRTFEGPWRERPPDRVTDRDSYPWLTLEAIRGPTDAVPPLVVYFLDSADRNPAATVIERSVVEAVVGEDGQIRYRGRFVLSRWLPSGVELEMIHERTIDAWFDGRKIEPQVGPASAGRNRTLRIPLPELKASKSTGLLELRWIDPLGRSRGREVTLHPPLYAESLHLTLPRWHVTLPEGSMGIDLHESLRPDSPGDWLRKGFGFRSGAVNPTDALDAWIAGSEFPDVEAPSGTVSGMAPSATRVVTLLLLPQPLWMGAWSVAAVAIGFVMSRMRSRYLGMSLAVLGLLTIVLVATWPTLGRQILSAMVPGLIGLAALLSLLGVWRWWAARRERMQLGFSGAWSESMASEPGRTGSSAARPVAGL